MLITVGSEICRHAKGKGPEEDATASDESLEYSRSQHGAALPDRLYLLIFHNRPFCSDIKEPICIVNEILSHKFIFLES